MHENVRVYTAEINCSGYLSIPILCLIQRTTVTSLSASVSSKLSSRDIYAVGGRTYALHSNHEQIKRVFFKHLFCLGCSGPLDNARTIPEWFKNNLKKKNQKSYNKFTILYQNRS